MHQNVEWGAWYHRSFSLLFCLALAWTSSAETILHLRNGDRITGEIVTEKDGVVRLSSPALGEIAVPVQEIERREEISAPPETGETAAPDEDKKEAAPASEGREPQEPGKEQAVESPDFSKRITEFIKEWKGDIQLGANVGLGTKDRHTLTGRIKATHVDGRLRNVLHYDATYGRTEGVLSDNRMDGSWKVDYELGNRYSVYNAIGAGFDEVREIDLQYDVGPGFGYRLVSLTNFVLRTEWGGNYQEQYFANNDVQRRYSVRLAEEFFWQITPRIRMEEKVEFFPEISDFGEYRVRLTLDLSYLFLENLTLSLNVIDLYDTDVPEGVSNNDLQIRSLIGVKF